MDQSTRTNVKRKAASDLPMPSHHYHYANVVPPRFISCKMMRTSTAPARPVTPAAAALARPPSEASFAALPRELFFNIVAYLGPTSSSLGALSQVTRDHNAIMKSIGNVMLQRAQLRFRTPVQPKAMNESSVSLFVRHARVSKVVHDQCEVLNDVLKKDFPIINTLSLLDTPKLPIEFISRRLSNPPAIDSAVDEFRPMVESSEVNQALNVALCLLGCPKQHYFADVNEAQVIAANAATTALEWRVSSLCSKIGAKAYKYAKSRMCQRYEQEDELFSTYAVTDDMMPPEDEDYSDYDEDDDDDISMDPSEMEADEDMTILDKASLVMQHIVMREQQRVRRLTGQTSLSNQFALNKIGQQGRPQFAFA